MSNRDFDRALEAVFEDRATAFSDDLRGMLRALFEEGVKTGRERERGLSGEILRRLEAAKDRAIADSLVALRDFESTLVEQHDRLPSWEKLSPENIRQAREQIERLGRDRLGRDRLANEWFMGVDPGSPSMSSVLEFHGGFESGPPPREFHLAPEGLLFDREKRTSGMKPEDI